MITGSRESLIASAMSATTTKRYPVSRVTAGSSRVVSAGAEEDARARQAAQDPALAAAGAGGSLPPAAPGRGMGAAVAAARDPRKARRELNMDFGNFLRTLAVIAIRTSDRGHEPDQAEPLLMNLLETMVLPNAERRLPTLVAQQLQSEDVAQLNEWFGEQLQVVFAHYADAYDRRLRQLGRRPRGTPLELPLLDLGFLEAARAADLITA